MIRTLLCSALLLLAGLAGCVTPPTPDKSSVTVETDKFSSVVTLSGPHDAKFDRPFGDLLEISYLRSFITKGPTHLVTHQLYVELNYHGPWKHFDSAADDTARSLAVVPIANDVGGCSASDCKLKETVGIDLDEATLRSRASTGLQIKISARSGDAIVLDISSIQIRAQLDAVESYLRSPAG